MKKLTRKIVALTLSLVMCISFSNTTLLMPTTRISVLLLKQAK
jgi:hypothetical protein